MKKMIGFLALVFIVLFVPGAFAGEKQLTFAWEQEISTDFAGWKLYSSETAGGPYQLEAEIPYGGTAQVTYESTQPIVSPDSQERTLYFVLTAFDNEGNESDYSNEVSALIDFLPPGVPFSLTVTVQAQ